MNTQHETGCCPRFDPESWEGKQVTWNHKLFVKDRVASVFHIPLNFGKVIRRNLEKIEPQKAMEEPALVLSDENSLWGSDLYIAVTKDVPGTQMTVLSGTFCAKVYEGPFQNAGHWHEHMLSQMKSEGRTVKKVYFFYTTCPKCAKAYGKNYVVVLAQVG